MQTKSSLILRRTGLDDANHTAQSLQFPFRPCSAIAESLGVWPGEMVMMLDEKEGC
jgi:hypothetical protein